MNDEQDPTTIKAETNSDNGVETKPKRKKVARACTHCHKAHMTCDSGRPCKRCVQRGLDQTCEDAPRKRKKYLDDVPNSSLSIKRTNSNPQNGYELHQVQSLDSTLANHQQHYGNHYNYAPPLQSRQSNERIHQLQSDQQQQPQPQISRGSSSGSQIPYQQIQQQPQTIQSSFQNQTHEILPSNHRTYQATMFQHSATAPELMQANSKYYVQDIFNHHQLQQSQNQYQQHQQLSQNQHQHQQQSQNQHQHQQQQPHNQQSEQQLQRPHLNPTSPSSYIQNQRKTKFLSTAADLEYATLSNILQDNLGGHHTTSNEGTPNSQHFSPNLSPHNNVPNTISKVTSRETAPDQSTLDKNSDIPPIPSIDTRTSIYDDSKYPKCDDSINQYLLGKTDSDNIVTFPDIITALEEMKKNDYAVYQERNSKSNLSFSIGISHEDNGSTIGKDESIFKEPEEIYAKVKKPFSYTPGYHSLIAYLRKRFSKPMLVKMAESMASYRPSFIACTNSLKEHDLIFMEQCFQRTLLTYDNFIKISGTPTIVWRRTGEIAYVGDEFCILTGWNKDELIGNGKRKFIVELLDDKSVVEYFQVFSRIAFGDFLGATITECTLLTPKTDVKIRTGFLKATIELLPKMASSSSPHHHAKLTPNLIVSVSIICLGSLQFGYHMAELNSPELVLSCRKSQPGAIPYEQSFFGSRGYEKCISMTPEQIGLVTSIFSIGGLIGSFYVGYLADKYGRKFTGYLHCLMYIIGSMINGLSNTYISLLIGRFVCGLGAGSALVITSLYINEVSPINSKGLLGSMNQVSINVGILFTQLLSLKWSNDNDWRWLLIMGGIIAMINIVVLALLVHESPMWLANQGSKDQAFFVLHKLRGGNYSFVSEEVNSWKTTSSEETEGFMENGDLGEVNPEELEQQKKNSVTVKEYITSPEFRPSLIASTGILILQQFDGINSIIFYGVSVLVSIFPNHSIIINCLISTVNVIVTFGSATVVDKLGRKPLLLISVSFLSLATTFMGFGIITKSSILSILGTFTFITFFAIGLGPIPFLLVGEVTQPNAKASAQSFGTSLNWIATFIVGYLFPILLHSIGGSVYFIFTGMCIFSVWFISKYIPETKGKTSYAEVWSHFN
ncbi:hypothetical protein KGF54_004001 [Candida jiufengensis]|uniref:uncharacterized protein n=1 Tax=Candida jiufengensis TaxID=497108 RepID=UPI0022255FA4|nr:uncharacterized protein KGF54_004001 [Candida jiufengensis]KAI5950927.1 hypothetical protein KGF54_004001 [Candida jiufengensis]